MRYYIATRLERHEDHNRVRDLMAARGHEITYDWTAHGPVWRDGFGRIREVSQLELQGVLDADVVIVLLPGGRGTHAELGMALAAGKRVILHSTDPATLGATPETCAFYHHPLVWPSMDSYEELVAHLDELGGPRSPTADRWCVVSDDDGHRCLVPLDLRAQALERLRDVATYADMSAEERLPYVRPSGPDRAVRLEGGVLSFERPLVDGRQP